MVELSFAALNLLKFASFMLVMFGSVVYLFRFVAGVTKLFLLTVLEKIMVH